MDNTLDRFAFGVLERSYQGRINSAEEWITTKVTPVPPQPGGPLLTAERVDVALPRHADDGWRDPLFLARDVDAAAKLTSKPTLLAYATLFFPQVLQAHQAFREAWLVADQIAAEHNLPVVVVQHVPSRAGSNNPIHCHLNIVPRYVRAGTAGLAVASDADLIHLEFDETPGGYAMVSINLAMPREPACHFYTECRLFLPAGASRAVILPRDGGRGHFSILPDEIVHKDGKPKGLVKDGLRRADRRLRALLKNGADVTGQVIIQEWPVAA